MTPCAFLQYILPEVEEEVDAGLVELGSVRGVLMRASMACHSDV